MSSNSMIAGPPAALFTDWQAAAKLIDHAVLQPDATRNQLITRCEEAVRYGFHAVMVNPANVTLAAAQLRGTKVKVGTVIGFPLGANLTATKLAEAEAVLRAGAQELDVVINIGALKSGDRTLAKTEISLLTQLCHANGAIIKIILENALLTQEEKILVCALSLDIGADFVKTSTGFAASGATPRDVAIMRGVVGHRLGVKAAGGVRTLAQMAELVEAGANRIGTSAGVEIVREFGAPGV